jgi:hypothetical protein
MSHIVESIKNSSTLQQGKNQKVSMETILFILGTLVFLSSSTVLLNDRVFKWIFQTHHDQNTQSIGKISRYIKDVRRKVGGEVTWINLQSSEPVYQGDSVFSAENSEATIQFNNGIEVLVGSNSLVIIQLLDKTPDIDVQLGSVGGSIQGAGTGGGGSLRIRSKGQDSAIDLKQEGDKAVQLRYEVAEGGKANLDVLTGSISVVSKNQSTSLKKDGGLSEVQTFSIELISPKINQEFWMSRVESIHFQWHGNESKTNVLEFSKSYDFKEILKKTEVSGNSAYVVFSEKEEGRIYWRLKGIAEASLNPPQSSVQSFSIMQNLAPTAVFPSAGESIHFTTEPILLRWSFRRPIFLASSSKFYWKSSEV